MKCDGVLIQNAGLFIADLFIGLPSIILLIGFLITTLLLLKKQDIKAGRCTYAWVSMIISVLMVILFFLAVYVLEDCDFSLSDTLFTSAPLMILSVLLIFLGKRLIHKNRTSS